MNKEQLKAQHAVVIRECCEEYLQAYLSRADTGKDEQKPLKPKCYWAPDEYDVSYDCFDDSDLIHDLFPDGAKVGDGYVLSEAYYFPAHFRIVKIPDDMSDDYEVERVNGMDIYLHPQPIQQQQRGQDIERRKEES